MKKRIKARAKKTVRQIKKNIRKATPKRSTRAKAKRIVRKTQSQARKLQRKVEKKAEQIKEKVSEVLAERQIGYVSHFFTGIGVGIIELTEGPLRVGDKIHVKGETTDLTQTIDSMQYNHEPVESASRGKSVGIKMVDRVREHDRVFVV